MLDLETYSAYCLACDKELSLMEVSKHSESLCLDEYGNLINYKEEKNNENA